MALGWRSAAGLLAAALAVAAAGLTSAVAQDGSASGYLGANVPDSSVFIPPPPPVGSPADTVDVSTFDNTRRLQGSPRWSLATSDAVQSPAAMLADFQCAVGAPLSAATAPRLNHLLTRLARDAGSIVNKAKDKYQRPRPFTRRPGPICVDNRDDIAKSWSYPSGHSTGGWSTALVLAELAPDRAAQILARGRAYGESRVVCGVHYVSDIEAGRSNAAGLVAALHADPAFRADVAAARAELEGLRKSAPAPAGAQCDLQAQASAQTPW